jgi:hypothetical protein
LGLNTHKFFFNKIEYIILYKRLLLWSSLSASISSSTATAICMHTRTEWINIFRDMHLCTKYEILLYNNSIIIFFFHLRFDMHTHTSVYMHYCKSGDTKNKTQTYTHTQTRKAIKMIIILMNNLMHTHKKTMVNILLNSSFLKQFIMETKRNRTF